jgi:hypothetical protein
MKVFATGVSATDAVIHTAFDRDFSKFALVVAGR